MKRWPIWVWFAAGAVIWAIMKTTNSTTGESPTAQVIRIAKAIAVAEGDTFRNNPGNLRPVGGGPVLTFSTPDEGWNALYKQVRLMLAGAYGLYSADEPLTEVARTYTGEARYMDWARNVAAVLGVSVDTRLGDL